MLSEMFQRVYVVNLPRRRDRLDSFFEQLPADWPFQSPEVFHALDGCLSSTPKWWNGGEGAWGCYRSHIRIIEDCLNDGVESVLILEDDAVCVENFKEKTQVFFDHLPQDWEMVYLGGQHLEENVRLPRKVNDWVYKPYNINRTHCFAFRGRQMMTTVYEHLNDFASWKVDHHIDHYLGELHKRTEKGLYVPAEWLVEQAAGTSDVCNSSVGPRRFDGAKRLSDPEIDRPGVAILGNYFGGTNTVAGVLHSLGISLGTEVSLSENDGAPCFFEDHWLSVKCRNCYAEPWLTEQTSREDRVNQLKHWAGDQCRSKQSSQDFFCGKHPILSLMGEEIMESWRDPKFICVDRDDKDCIASVRNASWGWHDASIEHSVKSLRECYEKFISRYSPRCLRIDYAEMIRNPEPSINALCQFLNINPADASRRNAIDLVHQSQNDIVRIVAK